MNYNVQIFESFFFFFIMILKLFFCILEKEWEDFYPDVALDHTYDAVQPPIIQENPSSTYYITNCIFTDLTAFGIIHFKFSYASTKVLMEETALQNCTSTYQQSGSYYGAVFMLYNEGNAVHNRNSYFKCKSKNQPYWEAFGQQTTNISKCIYSSIISCGINEREKGITFSMNYGDPYIENINSSYNNDYYMAGGAIDPSIQTGICKFASICNNTQTQCCFIFSQSYGKGVNVSYFNFNGNQCPKTYPLWISYFTSYFKQCCFVNNVNNNFQSDNGRLYAINCAFDNIQTQGIEILTEDDNNDDACGIAGYHDPTENPGNEETFVPNILSRSVTLDCISLIAASSVY